LALTVTIEEPIVTKEITIENTWIDWLAGDCDDRYRIIDIIMERKREGMISSSIKNG
jgi:hypothetical protein